MSLFFDHDGVTMVAVREACDQIGLTLRAQIARIRRDPTLDRGRVMVARPTPGGPQKMTCLPVPLVMRWLSSVRADHTERQARSPLLRTRFECLRRMRDT